MAFVERFPRRRRSLLQTEPGASILIGHALVALEAWTKTTHLTMLMVPANGKKLHLDIHLRSGHAQLVSEEFPEASPKMALDTASRTENADSQAT